MRCDTDWRYLVLLFVFLGAVFGRTVTVFADVAPGGAPHQQRSLSDGNANSPAIDPAISRTKRWSLGMRMFLPGHASAGVASPTGGHDIACSSTPVDGCESLPSGFAAPNTSGLQNNYGAIPGFSLDAAMAITNRSEVGLAVDFSTRENASHPSTSITDQNRITQAAEGHRSPERWLQIDLAGRFRRSGAEQSIGGGPVVTPYVGFGAGVSHYATLPTTTARFSLPPPPVAVAKSLEYGWTPNFQISTGAQFKTGGTPLFDLEVRYIWLATNVIDANGIRIGAGLRYRF